MPLPPITPEHVGCSTDCCPGNTHQKIMRMDVRYEVAVEKVKKNLFGDKKLRDGRTDGRGAEIESTENVSGK